MTQNINLDLSSEVKDAGLSGVEAAKRALISVDLASQGKKVWIPAVMLC